MKDVDERLKMLALYSPIVRNTLTRGGDATDVAIALWVEVQTMRRCELNRMSRSTSPLFSDMIEKEDK